MFQQQKSQQIYIKSISEQINRFFGGGLHKGIITQLYGEAGSGKSQMAMYFALGALQRNIPTCYLSTQKQLGWSRFTTLAYKVMNQAEFQQNERFLMYKKSTDFNTGNLFIEESMKKIKQQKRGGLLIIDSIHCFVMNCLQNCPEADVFTKSRKQAEIVNRIRWLAKMTGSAVLLINHAADAMDKRRSGILTRNVVAGLGQSWQLNIDENIYLRRRGQLRQLCVIFSPKCSTKQKKKFRIQNEGFKWISEQGVQYDQ